MNILFYCSEYPPYKTGGIGTVIKIIAERLVLSGHNVYVIGYYSSQCIKDTYEFDNGVHVYRYNLGYRSSYFLSKCFSILHKLKLSGTIFKKELSFGFCRSK